MKDGTGRSIVAEVLIIALPIILLFMLFDKKPLRDRIDMENITGEVQVYLSYEKEIKTENGYSYRPEKIEICAGKDNKAIQEVLRLLSSAKTRVIKGENGILTSSPGLETVSVLYYTETSRIDMFISSEHSILYTDIFADEGISRMVFDVPDDTFEQLKNLTVKYGEIK